MQHHENRCGFCEHAHIYRYANVDRASSKYESFNYHIKCKIQNGKSRKPKYEIIEQRSTQVPSEA